MSGSLVHGFRLLLVGAIWFTPGKVYGQSLPAAAEVVEKLLARSAEVARADQATVWVYDKTSVIEELGSKGQVTGSTEKLHRVRTVRGIPFSRLVKIQGQPLSEGERQKEDQREAEFRKRISGRDANAVASRKEALITRELVDRYRFEVRKREMIGGRPTLRLSFAVKPEKAAKEAGIQDRILNRLAGTLWVDEASSEVARLHVELTEGLSLGWLGILGSLSECRFSLVRRPMPDGAWLPLTQETQITARKLTSSVHFRVKEESANFQTEPVS